MNRAGTPPLAPFPQVHRQLRIVALALGLLVSGLRASVTLGGDDTLGPATRSANSTSGSHQATTWTGSRCGTCHDIDALFSHPVDVVPSMPVPAHLPLVNGRITCATCHDNRSAADHLMARREHTALLRGPAAGLGLCVECHSPTGTTRRDMHAMMLGQAHLNRPDDDGANSPSSADRSLEPLDRESRTCLGCHDGFLASEAGYRTADSGEPWLSRGSSIGAGHPIGIEYNPVGRRGAGGSLKPVAGLDRRIRLVDNRVSCGSCHSPFSDRRALLVMSNLRSGLCLSCHRF